MHEIHILMWINITMLLYFLFHVIDEKESITTLLISLISSFCIVHFVISCDFIFSLS
jgi:putative effector of murein hydrolase